MNTNEKRWAIYVPGPDEYHAMPSHEAAELAARQHNSSGCIEHIAELTGMEQPRLLASVCEWPFDADGHADELADALNEARAAALQRIAAAAGVESADPGRVADIVCAALESPFGRHGFSGLVCHMMRASDELAAGAEALGAAVNRHAEALEEFACAENDDDDELVFPFVILLDEAESHLTECHERVVRQAQRYGRRAERVRSAITGYQSDRAADALARLGDGAAK